MISFHSIFPCNLVFKSEVDRIWNMEENLKGNRAPESMHLCNWVDNNNEMKHSHIHDENCLAISIIIFHNFQVQAELIRKSRWVL